VADPDVAIRPVASAPAQVGTPAGPPGPPVVGQPAVASALPHPQRSAVGGSRHRALDGSARAVALTTAAVELPAGAVVLIAAHEASADALQLIVAVAAGVVVLCRVALGATRAGWCGAIALGTFALVQGSIVGPTFGDDGDLRLGATLLALGVLAHVAGLVPAVTLAGLDQGRREDVTPALFASALCGGLGVLAAVAAAKAVGGDDPRLDALVPYAAAAMALLAMAEVCGHHRIGAGFPGTVALVAVVAAAADVLLLVGDGGATSDTAVTAVTAASGLAVTGLLVATALASPRPLVVPADEALDGPRFVGWEMAVVLLVAVGARAVSSRPLWLDEAQLARVTQGSLSSTLDSARSAHAHPPLFDALVWGSRELFGSSDLALRMPSLLAGVLLVPAVYVTGERLYDRRVGLIAAAIVAVGPGFIWLSDGVQPGAVAALLATVSLLTLLNAAQRGRMTDWTLFGLATPALLWSHQLALVHVVVLHLAAGVVLWRHRQRGEPIRRFAAGWALALGLGGAALVALVVYRHGLGPPDVLPPYEYATTGAPGAGRSVFGLAGTALTGLLGFHPADVTSRLLALWPMCMLAAFALLGRVWSGRGVLVLALISAPFVTLLGLQVLGSPRNPPFALGWAATAIPMLAIGVGTVVGRFGRWRSVRLVALAAVALLVIAAVDQAERVEPIPRFDIEATLDDLHDTVQPGDIVVVAPPLLQDTVAREARGAVIVPASQATSERLAGAGRVLVFGAFGWTDDDPSLDQTLALVRDLSAQRDLTAEQEHGDAKLWTFD
jgi:4-amino-4-deoxy-L-arabinose transferase-like glycosyltransferase